MRNIGINIELKPNNGKEKENVLAIKKMLNKKKYDHKCFFSSFTQVF